MSDSSSPQLNENQLRALSRREIQALAKKEHIKPANASTDKLIQRLLEKFSAAATVVSSFTKAQANAASIDASPLQQRRSVRLAISESNPVPADIPTDVRTLTGTDRGSASTLVGPPTTDSTPLQSTSRLAVAAPLTAGPAFLAPRSANVAPTAPRPPPLPTEPTTNLLETYQHQLHLLNTKLVPVPEGLSRMEHILPHVERTAKAVTADFKTLVWDGYYLERDFVAVMKQKQVLWDGTNIMPPGPARDKWHAFLDDAAEEATRRAEARSVNLESDASSSRRKRRRETENGVGDLKEPSKRHKKGSTLLATLRVVDY